MTEAQLTAFAEQFQQLADSVGVIGQNSPYRNARGEIEQQDVDRYVQLASPVFVALGKLLRDLVVHGGFPGLVFWAKAIPNWQHDTSIPKAPHEREPLDAVDYWVLFTALALEQPLFADGFEEPAGHEPKTWGGCAWPELVRDALCAGTGEYRFLDPTGLPDKVYLCAISQRFAKVLARECRRHASPGGNTGYRTRSVSERAIMEALSRACELVNQTDLAGLCDISRRKLGPILKQLEEEGIVARPEGAHSGYCLTPQGRDLL